ncbi:nuclear transport factor 2 family protein [Hyphobacterium sp. HN65]|uniref:Nuclear transport factor 2 family protein n=1 Tax=Hyphobacterium lacteum TaxID=3116575 RepID=A0ABU7LRI3_9PROT|nr:nuclear transport factor 2 family protein [Hyphobacterium sp. HN65]MEE2526513.1 nuclear transport factor 2 family protein [Hyphobacterium sp. HN65]
MILVLLSSFALQSVADRCDAGDAAAEIRAQRAAFNTAIAERDLDTIADVLNEDVVLIAGTYSDLFLDEMTQLQVWQDDFITEDRLVYVRIPDCVQVSPLMPLAMEYGTWIGRRETDPESGFVAGSYAAKWALTDGEWRLDAETFMTESCEGDLCPSRD